MRQIAKQNFLDFYIYPPLGVEDYRYTFATGKVRVLLSLMLDKATFLDMANAGDFAKAAEMLQGTEYALPNDTKDFGEVERFLLDKRSGVRSFFADLAGDTPVVELMRSRTDFANMRLAVRRTVTDKPIGTDYTNDGNFSADLFKEVFEQEKYNLFPEHMRQAVEEAVLSYYEDKDIRQIDYAIDRVQTRYKLSMARKLKNIFLLGLFRIQIDLANIRMILRLKFVESQQQKLFLQGGFVEPDRFCRAMDTDYESLGQLFFVTPYHRLVEEAASYLMSEKSFLRAEQLCDAHIRGFLESTTEITAGLQPLIAYLLLKEEEIRKLRLVLTGKKNSLAGKLLVDRLGE